MKHPIIQAVFLAVFGLVFCGAVPGLAAESMVSAGYSHVLGLKAGGTVVASGWNSDGQCEVRAWSGIRQVSAGGDHSVGLKNDGTVVAAGRNTSGQCNVGGWADIEQVAAGRYHTVGLLSTASATCPG